MYVYDTQCVCVLINVLKSTHEELICFVCYSVLHINAIKRNQKSQTNHKLPIFTMLETVRATIKKSLVRVEERETLKAKATTKYS